MTAAASTRIDYCPISVLSGVWRQWLDYFAEETCHILHFLYTHLEEVLNCHQMSPASSASRFRGRARERTSMGRGVIRTFNPGPVEIRGLHACRGRDIYSSLVMLLLDPIYFIFIELRGSRPMPIDKLHRNEVLSLASKQEPKDRRRKSRLPTSPPSFSC